MKRVVFLLLLTVSLGADIWQPALYTEGRAGNFRKGGGALVFAPYGQDCRQLLFAQVRAGIFRELYAGTLGAGFRRIESWWAWGVNAFFDVARSNSNRVYYQGGLGAEWFGDCWLFRVNGYWPSRNQHTLDSRRTSVLFTRPAPEVNGPPGENIFSTDTMFNNTEQGYHGFDVEVGRGRQIGCGQLWGYAGYYYFDASKAQTQQGPRLRLEYTLDDFLAWCPIELTLGGDWERNDRHGSTFSGYVSARLPLWTGCNTGRSSSCCDSMCRVLGDPVFRNRAIWVDREVLLGNCATIQLPQKIYFFQEGASGAGTQIDPTSFTSATVNSGPGDILFALANAGDIDLSGATLFMQENQQLYSFGPNVRAIIDLGAVRQLTVRPLSGAATAAATIVQSISNADMIDMDTNPVINGLIIDGGGMALRGLVGTDTLDVGALKVVDVALRNFFFDMTGPIGGNAIEFDRYATASIERCFIDNNMVVGTTGCLATNTAETNGLKLSLLRTNFVDNDTAVRFGYNGQTSQLLARGCGFTGFLTTGPVTSSTVGIIPVGTGLTDLDMLVDDCQFDNLPIGMESLFNGAGDIAAGGRSASAVVNSRFGTVTPIRITGLEITNPRVTAGIGQDLIAVARNRVTVNADGGSPTNILQGSTGQPLVQQRSLIQENTLLATGNSGDKRGIQLSSGNVCTTVRNNGITAIGGSIRDILVSGGGVTIDGNVPSMAGVGITIDVVGLATNLNSLGPLNNGASVMPVAGTTNTPIPCQLP